MPTAAPTGSPVLGTAPARLWSVDAAKGVNEYPTGLQAMRTVGELEGVAHTLFGGASPEHVARIAHGNAVLGSYTSAGGTVVTTGCTDWAYGLAGGDPLVAAGHPQRARPPVRRLTVRVAAMTPAEIDALADTVFAAIEAGDVDGVRRIYADDVTVWHNFDQVDQSRDENLRTLGWMHAHAAGLRYTEVRRIVLDHGFVQQHVLQATAKNGTVMSIPAMLNMHCAGGRITRIEEYLDPAQAAALSLSTTPTCRPRREPGPRRPAAA